MNYLKIEKLKNNCPKIFIHLFLSSIACIKGEGYEKKHKNNCGKG